jgi:two-component system sensor histidine kinase KdpD
MNQPDRRGVLRIYLGYAPGVGKTYSMLDEANRRAGRGTDVVIGYLEPHGRAKTLERRGDLEALPTRKVSYQGSEFDEMDVDAILARKPEFVLVDELAHTNVPGSRNRHRWEDVEELLDAGISVISTLNVAHLESLKEAVEHITGVRQTETIPDAVVRQTDQIELVDMSPMALRRRLVHGNVFAQGEAEAALGSFFRETNLTQLRELALMWLADRVEESLQDYMTEHGISEPWETRERVVVLVAGRPEEERVIERAAAIAKRRRGELVALHVTAGAGLKSNPPEAMEGLRLLVDELGGRWREVEGTNVAETALRVANAEKATQMVLAPGRSKLWDRLTGGFVGELLGRSIESRLLRGAGSIDVHIISPGTPQASAPPVGQAGRFNRRRLGRIAAAAAGLALLTLVLVGISPGPELASIILLIYLTTVVLISVWCGGRVGLAAAVVSFGLANYFFIPPRHAFGIRQPSDMIAMLAFLAISVGISILIGRWSALANEAGRARAQAGGLLRLSAGFSGPDDLLASLLDHLRASFQLTSVAVLHRKSSGKGSAWVPEAFSGTPVPAQPEDGTNWIELAGGKIFAIGAPRLKRADRQVLEAFAPYVAAALRDRELKAQASTAFRIAEINELRGAILHDVSHDLRSPLAAIKASATSLLQPDVDWPEQDSDQFLETIDVETDRLTTLVTNLLDMSRLQSGALGALPDRCDLEEVVYRAIASLGRRITDLEIDFPDAVGPVQADPTLLERAIANLIQNALKWSPAGRRVRILAVPAGNRVELRIVDRGPGIPEPERRRVFEPFQRADPSNRQHGVGLGLAVARGFVETTGGSLAIEDTPGGGATLVVSLEMAKFEART